MIVKIGDWIRFYTNSIRPGTTQIGEVKAILADGSFSVENAVMKFFVRPSDVKRILHINKAAGANGVQINTTDKAD